MLISTGCVSGDGKEFSAELTDFGRSQANDWIKAKVLADRVGVALGLVVRNADLSQLWRRRGKRNVGVRQNGVATASGEVTGSGQLPADRSQQLGVIAEKQEPVPGEAAVCQACLGFGLLHGLKEKDCHAGGAIPLHRIQLSVQKNGRARL